MAIGRGPTGRRTSVYHMLIQQPSVEHTNPPGILNVNLWMQMVKTDVVRLGLNHVLRMVSKVMSDYRCDLSIFTVILMNDESWHLRILSWILWITTQLLWISFSISLSVTTQLSQRSLRFVVSTRRQHPSSELQLQSVPDLGGGKHNLTEINLAEKWSQMWYTGWITSKILYKARHKYRFPNIVPK